MRGDIIRGISILAVCMMVAAAIGGVSYANTTDWGNNSIVNRTIIVEKFIPAQNATNETNETHVTVINNYNTEAADIINNYIQENNDIDVSTSIINSGTATIDVVNSFGTEGLSDGISVQVDSNTVAKPGEEVQIGVLKAGLKTKFTDKTEVSKPSGLVISDLFLGTEKKPCEYINVTNYNNFTAHLEGMKIETLSGGRVFELGDVSIQPGKTLKIYSAKKSAKDTIYSLGLPKEVTTKGGIWNNDGDTAFLVCAYDDSVISKFTK